ncbi:hypothetical protein [Streptomyces viridosporus]|uniref:hypothetical protein n=1 Tax=Streptomyces viridosporus TaxID=67581 RepID=UPI003327CF8F
MGTVITADALHNHASYLDERGAHCLAAVKKNHPALHGRIVDCPGTTSTWTTLSAPGPITATRSAA